MSATDQLSAALERPLPPSLPVGTGSAVFCLGNCFHPSEPIEKLELVVDGVRHRPAAFGMPRPDIGAPGTPGYRSGFWATIPVEARERPGGIELQVAARLARGAELVAPLGGIEVVQRHSPRVLSAAPERPGPALIAVCMATFEPDAELFTTQIESLRKQTDDAWVCLISDDCSSPEHFKRIEQIVAGDPRFEISRSDIRQGFYRNFERALEMAPVEAELLALCDQDDDWHPDKLEVLREALGEAVLAYSDQRLVDAHGGVLRDTLWKGRRNNHTNLVSMLVANTITGAAALFRRELAELALPFPDTPGFQFHDHWLGVAALAAGDVAYVDRPLYDYVQHAGAVFGDVTSGPGSARKGLRRLPSPRRDGIKGLLRAWRAAYFYGYLAREVQARTLLVRGATQIAPAKRRVLKRFVACESSPLAFAWLAARPLRALAGRTETLGTEGQLARGILWRRLVSARAGGARPLDAGFPPPDSFSQKRLRRWRARI